MSRSPTRKMLTPLATARMVSAMQTMAHSLDELVAISELAKPTVARYIKELQAARLIHVGDWARDSRGYPTLRQFKWGDAPDAACPLTTRTAAERMRNKRAMDKGTAL